MILYGANGTQLNIEDTYFAKGGEGFLYNLIDNNT